MIYNNYDSKPVILFFFKFQLIIIIVNAIIKCLFNLHHCMVIIYSLLFIIIVAS